MLLRSQAIFQISFEKVLQSRHPDPNFCSIYPELKIPTVLIFDIQHPVPPDYTFNRPNVALILISM